MKLTIVNCGDPDEYAVVKYQAMAPAYLAAYTPSHWDIELVDENFDVFDPHPCRADLVAFSALPRHVGRAYHYSKILRDRGIATVGGGLHVSAIPEEAVWHFDSIVEGEAEPVWENLLRDFESGQLRRHYVSNFDQSLEDIRLPDRRYIHPGYKIASLSTSRGCMNRCSFCYMGSLTKKKYRVLPKERIVEDFKQVSHRLVVFTDANFVGFTQEHIDSRKALCEELIRQKTKKYWAAQMTADVVKYPDLTSLLYRAGCRMAFVGFETIGEDGLGFIDKEHNVRIDYTDVVKTLQRSGVVVAASLILGLDTHDEDYERILKRWLDQAKPLFLNLGVLTPMPNTRLYHDVKREGRLLWDGPALWKHMDKGTNTIRYKKLSMEQMEKMYERIIRHFFRPRNIAATFLYHMFVKGRISLSILYLVSALKKRGNRCKTPSAVS